MNVEINIPDFDGNGIDVIWEKGACVELGYEDNQILIRANRDGLISLAKQMIYLAVNEVASGSHVHYDDYFLGNTPFELIIEMIKEKGRGRFT